MGDRGGWGLFTGPDTMPEGKGREGKGSVKGGKEGVCVYLK